MQRRHHSGNSVNFLPVKEGCFPLGKKKVRYVKKKHKEPQARTLKEWWRDQPPKTRKTIKNVLLVLFVLLILWQAWYWLIFNDGSLLIWGGKVSGAQENWLIGKGEKGKFSSFYKLGEVETPEGYIKSDVSVFGEAVTTSRYRNYKTDFTFITEEEGVLDEVGVTCVAKPAAEIMASSYASAQTFLNRTDPGLEGRGLTEIKTADTKLGPAQYYVYQNVTLDEEYSTFSYYQVLYMYIPSMYPDMCVMVMADDSPSSYTMYLTEDELLSAVLDVVDCIALTQ